MALPTPDNLKTMDYGYQGQPFVDVPAKSTINLDTMDIAYLAQPFVRNPGVAVVGWPNNYMGVLNANISKIDNVTKANIAKVCGV
jgi:hypothetical protein